MPTHDLSDHPQTADFQQKVAANDPVGGAPKDPENHDAPEELESLGRFSPQRFLSERMAAWRELRFAKNAGRQALARHRRLRAARPELTGRALYEAFVCERNGVGASAAQAVLQRAEASFAAWPADHDLIFRNVVQYLVISEYLVSHPTHHGTATNMARIIAKVIPKEL
jgi:hypothetical protein